MKKFTTVKIGVDKKYRLMHDICMDITVPNLGQVSGSDSSSDSKAAKNPEETINDLANELDPELKKITEDLEIAERQVFLRRAGLSIVEGYIKWAKVTGNTELSEALSQEGVENIIKRFATNPDQIPEILSSSSEKGVPDIVTSTDSNGTIKTVRKNEQEEAVNADNANGKLKITQP